MALISLEPCPIMVSLVCFKRLQGITLCRSIVTSIYYACRAALIHGSGAHKVKWSEKLALVENKFGANWKWLSYTVYLYKQTNKQTKPLRWSFSALSLWLHVDLFLLRHGHYWFITFVSFMSKNGWFTA